MVAKLESVQRCRLERAVRAWHRAKDGSDDVQKSCVERSGASREKAPAKGGQSASPPLSDLWWDLRRHVLRSTEWWTEADIAKRSGGAVDPLEFAQWRTFSFVFALNLGAGPEIYPAYAFDPERGYKPHPVMRPIIGRLSMVKESLGLAAWFASQNTDLGNRRPLDLLSHAPDQVLTAARKVFVDLQGDWLSEEEWNIYRAAGRDV